MMTTTDRFTVADFEVGKAYRIRFHGADRSRRVYVERTTSVFGGGFHYRMVRADKTVSPAEPHFTRVGSIADAEPVEFVAPSWERR